MPPLRSRRPGWRAWWPESFARIFFRNAINIGLPIVACPEAVADIAAGHPVEIDLAAGRLRNLATGHEFTFSPFTKELQAIIEAGGLMAFVKGQVQP